MKRMKSAVIVLTIVVLAAGFVRGWFAMSGPQRDSESNKVGVKITVDPDKMKEDAEQVKESAEKLEDKVREEFQDATRKTEPHSASPAPGSQ